MGYLKDFRESFSARLDGLDPEAMKEALNAACDAILESYRNGEKRGRADARKRAQEKGAGERRPKDK